MKPTNLFRKLLAWQRRRAMFHATHTTLRGLDARALRDIGLDPSEVMSAAAEASGRSQRQRLLRFHPLT